MLNAVYGLQSLSTRVIDSQDFLQNGVLRINLSYGEVTRDGKLVLLSPKEYSLLHYFMKHTDMLLPYQQLLTEIWGEEYNKDVTLLRNYVRRLREKIEANAASPEYIITEMDMGYRMESKKILQKKLKAA